MKQPQQAPGPEYTPLRGAQSTPRNADTEVGLAWGVHTQSQEADPQLRFPSCASVTGTLSIYLTKALFVSPHKDCLFLHSEGRENLSSPGLGSWARSTQGSPPLREAGVPGHQAGAGSGGEAEAGWNLRPRPLTMGRSVEPAACYLIISEWFLFLALNIYPYWVFTASQALYLLFFAVAMATTPGVQLLSDFK